MRFPRTFSRHKNTPGSGVPAFGVAGTDVSPPTVGPSEAIASNQMSARLMSGRGGNGRRLIVLTSYVGAAAPPIDVAGNLYIFEETTAKWYLVNAAPVTIKVGKVTEFDAVSLIDQAPRAADLTSGPGSVDVALVVDGTAASDGVYTFAIGFSY